MARGGRVTVDEVALSRFLNNEGNGFVFRALHEATEVVLQGAKRRAPTSPAGSEDPETGVRHPSGWLRSSLTGRVVPAGSDSWVGIVATPVSYALFVEFGTKPHVIRARNRRVLANTRTGDVFGPVVHHPGTPAQPFLRPALDDLKGKTFGYRGTAP